MKTFNQKVLYAVIGGIVGAILGHLFLAFVSGTFDPMSFRFWSWNWVNGILVETENREYFLEGFARFWWGAFVVGTSFGGAAGGVYLAGRR